LLRNVPTDPAGRLFQARLQFVRGAKGTAVGTLEQLVHDFPEMPLPHFYLGLAYAGQGEPSRAIATLNETLRQDPNFIWAYVSAGELHAQQGSPKLALEFANQALAHNPHFIPAIVLEANAYMQLGDYSTAVAELRSLNTAQPKNPLVLERLAIAAMSQRQYEQAEQELEEALRLQSSYVPAMADLAQLYGAQKRSRQLIQRLQLQIQRAPKQSRFYEMLGDAYLSNRDFSSSEQAFGAALRLDPDATMARIQLARVYASTGKIPDALQSAQTVVKSHPDFLAAYVVLANVYEQDGKVKDAEQAYQEALQRNGNFVPALNNLAWLYCENGGNLDMALGLVQKAKAAVPGDLTISDTFAWIQYRKGLYSSAAAMLEDVARQAPANATYQYHYGMSLWKTDRPNEAQGVLRRALQLNLSPREAEQTRLVLADLNQTPAKAKPQFSAPSQKN
jgi:predicted Zn-dependent protease